MRLRSIRRDLPAFLVLALCAAALSAGPQQPAGSPLAGSGQQPDLPRTASPQQPGLPRAGSQPQHQPPPRTPGRSPSNANYVLSATLDVVTHRIQGKGTLTWRNVSPLPATELRFHMYWNAWRDDYSTYAREARLAGEPIRASDGDRASIDLTRLTLRRDSQEAGSAVAVLPELRFIAPDDGNGADRTVAAVTVDRPVQPGETVEIDFSWLAHVPRPFDRTGVLGNYYLIAQWFPKIGVLDARGWQTRQFHVTTEYFADFGAYDVSLTVPSGWIVGATGREAGRSDNADGSTTHRYIARDVHDFAWTTSPDFLDQRQTLDRPGRPPLALRLLLQPEHRRQAERHWQAIRLALERYGEWFGPYAYDDLTVVDPVAIAAPDTQGADTGGMEYPQFITAGTRWISPSAMRDPEDVIVHEIGHQYFHTAVATNEVDAAWMDEGLTTYISSRLMDESYPGRFARTSRLFGGLVLWPYDEARWTRSVDGDGANSYRTAPDRDVPSDPSWKFDPATGRVVTYFRTTLWLHTLERMLGWETMRRALRVYYDRYAFTHPEPADFFDTVNEVSGQDLTWFFDAVQNHATTFDYAIGGVRTLRVENGAFDTVVTVRRIGTGVFPVDLVVNFDDGSSVRDRWDGVAPSRAFTYRRGTMVSRVEIDPDYILRLDVHRVNNSWTSEPQSPAAGARWGLRWFSWLEHQLLTYAFVI